MSGLAQDVRYALRSLRSRPLLVVVAVAVLALGIGASTAVFSVVDAVLLRPLPFAAPDRLLMVWMGLPEQNQPYIAVSYSFVETLRKRSRSLAAVAAMPETNSAFTIAGDVPARVNGRLVTGNFFDALGVRARLGRTFTESEDRVGAPRVVVISHGLWQRQFGRDPGAVGRSVVVGATPMTLIGVMPPEFRYPPGAELWTPVVTTMETALDTARGGARFGMQLLSGFALVALALAALGIYGVLVFMVGGRTREIGVRMALGARAADVLGLVLGQGLKPVGLGLAVGTAGSLALGRALSALLFGVAPHDALTMAGAAAVLAVAAVVACYFPARRAARLDPAAALRRE